MNCIVALPGQLFYNTQIPVCLWFLARTKANGHGADGTPLRDRRGETLFIDARELGEMADRTHRALIEQEIARVSGTYHAWRGDAGRDPPARSHPHPRALCGLSRAGGGRRAF